ncbi:hypothetical protein Ddc_24380 [Ditylenchus destructor]|nr:hypothetical protein Ddc_24380 [Ditylenchus destructor]
MCPRLQDQASLPDESAFMTAITSRASTTFQTIEQFQHRDDRGGGIQHNGLTSKTPEEATHDFGVGVLAGRIKTATAVMM